MSISLAPELESAVRAKVASGLYNNASEAICLLQNESIRGTSLLSSWEPAGPVKTRL